jgi:hypothetical protein
MGHSQGADGSCDESRGQQTTRALHCTVSQLLRFYPDAIFKQAVGLEAREAARGIANLCGFPEGSEADHSADANGGGAEGR